MAELAALARRAAGERHTIPQEWLREDLSQPGLSPEANCILVEAQGVPLAYATIHPELRIGRTVLEMCIHPDHAHPGLERQVVRCGMERSRQLGARVLHVCLPHSQFWADLLRAEGFSHVRTYWVMRWRRDRTPPVELARRLTLRSLRAGEEARLTDVQNAAFGDSWGFCPNTVEEVSYRVGMSRSGHDGVFLLERAGDIAGYCWTYILGEPDYLVGVIGMVGVVPAYRGQGLSKPLLLKGMEHMGGRGVKYVTLDVDGRNVAAIRLYTSVGFEKARELHWFEATLSPT
jgi:mycothiol synthase